MGGYIAHSLPKLTLGLTDSLSRLKHGIGIERSHQYSGPWTAQPSLVDGSRGFDSAGGYHIATDAKEAPEITESLELLYAHQGWQAELQQMAF